MKYCSVRKLLFFLPQDRKASSTYQPRRQMQVASGWQCLYSPVLIYWPEGQTIGGVKLTIHNNLALWPDRRRNTTTYIYAFPSRTGSGHGDRFVIKGKGCPPELISLGRNVMYMDLFWRSTFVIAGPREGYNPSPFTCYMTVIISELSS